MASSVQTPMNKSCLPWEVAKSNSRTSSAPAVALMTFTQPSRASAATSPMAIQSIRCSRGTSRRIIQTGRFPPGSGARGPGR